MPKELITEDDVRKVVVQRLNYWKGIGVVLNWERINCGRVRTQYGHFFYGAKDGFPDYFAEIINGRIIHICYFETKKPVGGIWSDEQIIFKAKHEGFDNVSYDVVTDPRIVDNRIDSIVKISDNKLIDADKHLMETYGNT